MKLAILIIILGGLFGFFKEHEEDGKEHEREDGKEHDDEDGKERGGSKESKDRL